ncbi:hypothetical protein EDB80DRAFT_819886 [Ilyonectria destructans]|nr:hypothetical protein EDB80DRAFT_819886 [Ilyonectria destructans]
MSSTAAPGGRLDADSYDPTSREAEGRELTKLIERINTRVLEARACYLRQGTPCSIPPLQHDRSTWSSVMGSINSFIEVRFDDAVTWTARIRRFNATSPPAALRDYIIQSNPVGVGFILMEKLAGKSLRWSIATQQQRKKVMNQLADTFLELHKYPFDLLGSLDKPGGSQVGAFARESLTDFGQSEMRTAGPFSSLEEYHTSSIRLILDLIIREEIYSQRAVDAYLIHRHIMDLVPPRRRQGRSYLVDEHFTMTGIIDWEWAHTAAPTHAFNSPIGFLPVADFSRGKNSLGDDEVAFARLLEEKGRQDLAQFVWNGRLQHRFAFCCGYDLAGWDGFLGFFRGLRDAVGLDDGLEWNEWKVTVLKRYKDDSGLQLLLTRHQSSLSHEM